MIFKTRLKTTVSRGMTMVELLVVITLIGLLAGTLLVIIDPRRQGGKARDAQRKSHLRQIQSALEMYRSDNGQYPAAGSALTCGAALSGGGNTYLPRIPCDPLGSSAYNSGNYVYLEGGNTYALAACLENDTDNDIGNMTPADFATAYPAAPAGCTTIFHVVNNP